MNPLVSIIVPVYNVEKYLRQCMESVLAQSYLNWEAILINDASVDKSELICEYFESIDNRIRQIKLSKNCGLAVARNKGLDDANGELIVFLDSDDVLPPDALKVLVEAKIKSESPIVAGRYLNFTGEVPKNIKTTSLTYRRITAVEAVERMFYQTAAPDPSSCAKIYDAALFSTLRFRPGILYEDLDLIYRVILKAGSISVMDDTVYFYRRRPNSITTTFNSQRLDVLVVTGEIIRFLSNPVNCKENGINDLWRERLLKSAKDRRMSAAFNILGLIYSCRENMPEAESECRKIICKYRKQSLYNPRVRLKNKIGILCSYIANFRLYKLLAGFVYS